MAGYVVQSAQNTATSSPGTVTLPAATRAGNTLIAMATVRNAGATNASLSTVTLGGVADNFGQAAAVGAPGAAAQLYWWLDPLCAGGQTSVVYTTTGGAGTEALTMNVLEVGGMIPLPAGPAAVDVASAGTATSASWNSGTTPATSWPAEIWASQVVAAGTRSVTGPGYPWVNLTSQPNGTISITQAGYELTAAAGTAFYAGTFAASQAYIAGVATFPGLVAAPSLPNYVAGSGPQQGDMNTLVTSPLGFFQQRTVFRAAQTTTTTTLPSGTPGATTTIAYDTIYEDPYQGWNTSTHAWRAPYTGWYQVEASVATGSSPANATVTIFINSPSVASGSGGLIMNAGNTVAHGTLWCFLVGGQDTVEVQAFVVSGSNVSTQNAAPSTVEILWVASAA